MQPIKILLSLFLLLSLAASVTSFVSKIPKCATQPLQTPHLWPTSRDEAFTASPNIGHRLLWLATKASHAPAIEALLDAGASPLGVDELGNPSRRTFVAASIRGDVRIVELLVEAGVDPNMFLIGGQDVQPDWYTCPELEAWQHGYCQPSPCESTYQYEKITTPITLAVEKSRTALVEWLFKTGQIHLSKRGYYRKLEGSLLEMAAGISHLPTFEVLMQHCDLKNGTDNDQHHFRVSTLLYRAGGTGDFDFIH
ncbi:hypothetical protein CH63R_13513 [Colletotrichum higginsianum IMI 349063]|uniref:Uncharacterized protein n=2 Tax=Colletotrichum higginsianum TaxID=80884 RepID=A0A1B7XRA8_COLHI|nr:hypothetical protein CH63R_13513 [Colletotrichum higginsianum IMI 349063]OBR02287.1 hypothetical protein CH63R_13513 [Colletotrichum higginsianum IMI 349063]TID07360.1 hypothetical protein CH35J_000051 [Colletotrichum higginsianum]